MNANAGATTTTSALSESEMIAQAEAALADISKVREATGKVIFGQEAVVERTLVALWQAAMRFLSAFLVWQRPSWSRHLASSLASMAAASSSRRT